MPLAILLLTPAIAFADTAAHSDTAGSHARDSSPPRGTTSGVEGAAQAPSVVGIAIRSDPGADGTYIGRDVIEVGVTFDQEVTVYTADGTPSLALTLGEATKPATYAGGSSTKTLNFESSVSIGYPPDMVGFIQGNNLRFSLVGDADPDGVSIAAGTITLNGGVIRNAAQMDAALAHPGLSAQSGHKVDGVVPTLSDAVVDETTATLEFHETLDSSSVPDAADFALSAGSGEPHTVSGVSVTGSHVVLTISPALGHGQEASVRYSWGAAVIRDVLGNRTFQVDARLTNETPAPTPPPINAQGPGVVSVAIGATAGTVYAGGTSIDVTVTFADEVVVDTADGTPSLDLAVGDLFRPASYVDGSGTAALTFRYTVTTGYPPDVARHMDYYSPYSAKLAVGDQDDDGTTIASSRIALNGGTIRKDGDDAKVALAGIATPSGHRVDGIRPGFQTRPVGNGDQISVVYSEVLDASSSPQPGDFTVNGGRSQTTISNTALVEQSLTVTIDPPLVRGQRAWISYGPSSSIRDAAGNPALAVRDSPIANRTPEPQPIIDPDAPSAIAIAFSSTPGPDATYAGGDAVGISVTFDHDVTVDTTNGTPSLGINVGGLTKTAVYADGSGTQRLVFRYTIAAGWPRNIAGILRLLGFSAPEGDEDDDGLSATKGEIALNGGAISGGAISGGAPRAANLGHPALLPQSGHKVDGVKPYAKLDSSVNGDTLRVVHSKALDAAARPDEGDFRIVAGDAERLVSGIAISGNALTLTLAWPVAAGDTVTYSYTPGNNPIRDLVGNPAFGEANLAVTNETPQTDNPTVSSISSGATHPTRETFTVTITFSESVTGLAADEVAVENGAGAGFAGSGATYTLDIRPNAKFEGDVTVTVPAGVAEDGSQNGNREGVQAFAVDTKAPVLAAGGGAVVDGATLTLAFHEPLAGDDPDPSAFSVGGGDLARVVTAAAVSGNTVALAVDPAVEHDEDGLTVGYAPASSPVRDAVGNAAASFSNHPVANDTPAPHAPSQVVGVTVEAQVKRLVVSWTAVADAEGYKVQWKSGSEGYESARQHVVVDGAASSYAISNLTAGTEYTVRVIATKRDAPDGKPSIEVAGTPRPIPVSVSVASAVAEEGDDVVFPVTLSRAAPNRLVVGWRLASGTATVGVDFSARESGSLTIGSGAAEGVIEVPTIQDGVIEDDETFTVTLHEHGGFPDWATLARTSATGTINDDDRRRNRAPLAAVEIPPQAMDVGDETQLFLADHFRDPDGDVLTYAVGTDDPEVATAEVAGNQATIRGIRHGRTRLTATASDHGGLSATLAFDVTVGSVVSFANAAATVREGQTARLVVVISRARDLATTLGYVLGADDPAYNDADEADIGHTVGTLVIAARETEAAIEIGIRDDNEIEPAREVFNVTLDASAADADNFALGTATSTITIHEGVCDRTPGVRDELRGSRHCAEVSSEELAGRVELDLVGRNIDALRSRDFLELRRLAGLNLSDNLLAGLPNGIFTGLSALTALQLQSNPGAPFALTPVLLRTDNADAAATGPATIVMHVAEGAPFAMRAHVSSTGGTLSADVATVPAGERQGTPITVTNTGSGAVRVTVEAAPPVPDHLCGQGQPCFMGIATTVPRPLVLFKEAPMATSPVPAREVLPGGPDRLDLARLFTSAAGDLLTYTAMSSDPALATVKVHGSILTIEPNEDGEEGVVAITVTATDSDGLTVTLVFNASIEPEVPSPLRGWRAALFQDQQD